MGPGPWLVMGDEIVIDKRGHKLWRHYAQCPVNRWGRGDRSRLQIYWQEHERPHT